MRSFTFPGSFEDADGPQALIWRIGPGTTGRFEISTLMYDVDVRGGDFDGLQPVLSAAAPG